MVEIENKPSVMPNAVWQYEKETDTWRLVDLDEQKFHYHKWLKDDTVKVKLERGQRGTYGWEITCEGEDQAQVIDRISQVDTELRARFSVWDKGE